MYQQKADIGNSGGYDTMTWNQVAAVRNGFSGGSYSPIKITNASNTSVTNTSIYTPPDFYGNGIGWVNDTTGNLSLNRSIIAANNAFTIPATATYGTSDYNVFSRINIGPYVTFDGNFYETNSQMPQFRTATSQDTNSYGVASSVFTGDPSAGDFRVDLSDALILGHDGNAGVTEHWNFNTRTIVSGPPEAWPVIPVTYQEAINYILDPEGWDFY